MTTVSPTVVASTTETIATAGTIAETFTVTARASIIKVTVL